MLYLAATDSKKSVHIIYKICLFFFFFLRGDQNFIAKILGCMSYTSVSYTKIIIAFVILFFTGIQTIIIAPRSKLTTILMTTQASMDRYKGVVYIIHNLKNVYLIN